MRTFLIRFLPYILLTIGIGSIIIFNYNPIITISMFLVLCIYNVLVNLYLVNENITKGMIWLHPIIDRILGAIAAIVYLGIFSWVILRHITFPTVFFIVLLTGLITLYLEYKLKIIDDKKGKQEKYVNDTSMADYKVVSHRTEKIFKITSIITTVMSILLIILSLYLKWWILFGVSIALLIIVAIALSIYEKYFTTRIEE